MLLVLPNELEILKNLRPLDRDVFYYLAERIDFKTGIVGKARRVSYGGMALDLSEQDVARRVKATLVKISVCQAENSVKRLVAAGLFERLSLSGMKKDLVLMRCFWSILLSGHDSVQNPVAGQLCHELLGIISLIGLNNKELQLNYNLSCGSEGGSVATTSLRQSSTTPECFLMTMDWEFSTDDMGLILKRAGYSLDKVNPAWVAEFVGYWWGEGKKQLSQRQWTIKLANRLIGFMGHPELFEGYLGNHVKAFRPSGLGAETDKPAWCNPPKDNDKLVPWMRKHGYADPAPGLTFGEARANLQRAIDIKYEPWRKGLS